ncbi:glutathione S-transferase N-terminal domain-containing protein [Halorhodospira sp. 9622]|uniref:glutathione S-transferase N-terminal domain-containing protein n=1 Tax=Halorhodospira sp. 9622 TaxID=2899136 RepID=UPI001EE96AE1|nr:glutathione S-transferase N-terminal domain-containing protein [Halorhodospira sp. 9622]MCG5538331.1 glutathione S-transferase N-terminal domain-containing protein [Halorhodospira sp. 9622]
MIELYSWPTPNGQKVHIALEEMGLAYRVHGVDIGKGEQFAEQFQRISPNGRIPAIVDSEGPGGQPFSVFESGAILIYLAEKSGQFLPTDPAARMRVIEWLMFQMGGVGPMFGQAGHFRNQAPERVDYGIERYTQETERLLGVLDRRLGEVPYLGGVAYSIADMATYPWVQVAERLGQRMGDFPNALRWSDEIGERPAVERGMAVLRQQ